MALRVLPLLPIIAILFAGAACNKELQTKPTSSLGVETLQPDVNHVDRLITGIHGYLSFAVHNQFYSSAQNLGLVLDLMGDDFIATSVKAWGKSEAAWSLHRNEAYTGPVYVWEDYYHIIGLANTTLKLLEEYKSHVDLYTRAKGELLALRAYAHFLLVQLYAQRYDRNSTNDHPGIIIRTEPLVGDAQREPIARSSVAQVYAQILSDLDGALALLAQKSPTAKYRLGLPAALGLRARVALAMEDWATAAQMAQRAIETSGAKLQSGKALLNGFNDWSATEWIWAYRIAEDRNPAFSSFFAFASWNFNSSRIRNFPTKISKSLYESMSPTDVRRKWWDPTGERELPEKSYTHVKYQNFKFEAKSKADSKGDYVRMRAAELYLIRAEALARSGDDAGAQGVLETFMKTRDPNYVRTASVGDALIEEIMANRRIELWGEGFRFLDLKRLNLPLDRTKAGNYPRLVAGDAMQVPAGDPAWQYKISRREIDGNRLCAQNP